MTQLDLSILIALGIIFIPYIVGILFHYFKEDIYTCNSFGHWITGFAILTLISTTLAMLILIWEISNLLLKL